MRSFPCNVARGRAFTLLEVVAGLTLMASVLVASLLSFSAHYQQRRIAESKLAAVDIADQLLHDLSARREGIPDAGRGIIPGRRNWFWQTRVIGVAAPAQVLVRVIRFEVVEVTSKGTLRPLAAVDVVKPLES